MIKQWTNFFILAAILKVLSVSLYFTWFRHLSTIDKEKDQQPQLVRKRE